MKKACIIFPRLSNLGGAENLIISVMDVMKRQGWYIILISDGVPKRGVSKSLFGIDLYKTIDKWYKLPTSKLSNIINDIKVYQKEKTMNKIEEIIKKENVNLIMVSQANAPKINSKIRKTFIVWCPFSRDMLKKEKKEKKTTKWHSSLHKNTIECPSDYSLISISEWVQKKVTGFWSCNSKILYPSCDINKTQTNLQKKKNWVVTLSRFSFFKHLHVALEIAKKLPELEFHFIGIARTPKNKLYLNQLKKNATKNCFFHVNVSQKEKNEILKKGKYGLHLTGYKMPLDKYMLQEHFGIVIAEMMSYGCIIQHYNAGFFPEYVLDKTQTFNDAQECINNIKFFEKNTNITKKTSEQNFKKSQLYSNENFEKNLKKILDQIK
jgi:glycosyltransferase involved in cell wall biosynthesis